MTARVGGLTQRFTLTLSSLAVVGDEAVAGDDDEKTINQKLRASPQLEHRMVSIIVESDENDLRVFSAHLDARGAVDALAAAVARIAQQVDEELHRRS